MSANTKYTNHQNAPEAVDFANRLQYMLDSKGWQQKRLAEELGVTRATVSRYINIPQLPTIAILMQIANIFGVSMDWLVGRTEDKQAYEGVTDDSKVVVNAYRRADDDHKRIVWTALWTYLEPGEAEYLKQLEERERGEGSVAS